MFLDELCAECKNYFVRDQSADVHEGTYTITGGTLALPFMAEGQYFRIVNSALNDGVYQYPATELADETFTGAIWAMAVPPAVIALAAEIEAWTQKNAEALASPYQSESFSGYSYSRQSVAGGGTYGWQNQFASRLNKYRRLSVL